MDFQIDILLETRRFDQLTPSEKTFVLMQMSEEEYDYQRNTILQSQAFLKNEAKGLTPNPATQIFLKETLSKSSQQTGIIAHIFQHKMPTWVTVAAICILFILLKGLPIIQPDKKPTYLVEQRVDTVFIEKLVQDSTPIIQPLKVDLEEKRAPSIYPIPENNKPNINTAVSHEDAQFYSDKIINAGLVNYDQLLSMEPSKTGITLANDSISQEFNRTIN